MLTIISIMIFKKRSMEGGSGWGIHVNPWLILVNVWQKPLQYYKVISLHLIKISWKKKRSLNFGSNKQLDSEN